jgi:hypothetical protein
MQLSRSTGTCPADTLDLTNPSIETLTQNCRCLTPQVLLKFNGPEFLEGQEDPAQSEDLERQQDA